MDLSAFSLFLQPTGKYLASRYGARGAQLISPVVVDGRRVSNPEIVIAVPREEERRYRREYQRQVREGALIDVGPEGYTAYIEAHQKAKADAAKAKAEAERAAAKAEADAAKAKAETKSKKSKPAGGES